MGKPGAYLSVRRKEHGVRGGVAALGDFADIVVDLPRSEQREQASRCMGCGVPFCQSGIAFNGERRATGCPLHNLVPETNDLLYRGRLRDAAARLALTNPFPEFTGRVCPAPCETACNLGLADEPVTIHDNERALSDFMWECGMEPLPAAAPDAPLVSVIGSGPAGLAAAWELARRGACVRVYERDERPGGLLMYGIPNMKLEKWVVERRVALMQESGIQFFCSMDAAGRAQIICEESRAVVLACGARSERRLDVPGAHLPGVVYALEYLSEATRALVEDRAPRISAQGKDVAVIGGGDTGVDCVATALRQGARSVRQIVRANRPPDRALAQGGGRACAEGMWPGPRGFFEQGYGQREAQEASGCDPRLWSTDTVGFSGDESGVRAVRIAGRDAQLACVTCAAESEVPAQLVIVAKGFTGAEQAVVEAFAPFSNVRVAGDARLGPTLVASAMADGLAVAAQVAGEVFR